MDQRPDRTPEGVASGPTKRPPNFVAGVINDRARFEQAVEELVAEGITRESIGILQGARGADAIGGRHEGTSWLHRAAEFLSEERDYVARYEEEARQGHYVVGVPLPDASEATRKRIRAVLTAHGAHSIASSTPWTHTGER
jgi:hypothetical protein